jgi:Ca2+-binding EF-hand superfamily protein
MKTTQRRKPTLGRGPSRWHLLLLAIFLAALNGCATNKNLQPAQATAGTGEGGFELADANHDGKLSRAEASDFIAGQVFTARDTNHDGRITNGEWVAADPRDAAGFKKRDANRDGTMTKDEALKYARAHGMTAKAFAEADKTHDGVLDRAEVEAYYSSKEGSPQ